MYNETTGIAIARETISLSYQAFEGTKVFRWF